MLVFVLFHLALNLFTLKLNTSYSFIIFFFYILIIKLKIWILIRACWYHKTNYCVFNFTYSIKIKSVFSCHVNWYKHLFILSSKDLIFFHFFNTGKIAWIVSKLCLSNLRVFSCKFLDFLEVLHQHFTQFPFQFFKCAEKMFL